MRHTGLSDLPPPPAVILATQLEIHHDNRDLGAGDNKDHKDKEQEPEEVVELVLVYGGEDKEQLYETGAKWENAGHQSAHHGMHVPDLCRHLQKYKN